MVRFSEYLYHSTSLCFQSQAGVDFVHQLRPTLRRDDGDRAKSAAIGVSNQSSFVEPKVVINVGSMTTGSAGS